MDPSTAIHSDLREDYAFCRRLATAHYENFPVGSFLLPKQIRPHVYSVYAFARAADDFADEPGLDRAERLTRLEAWEEKLSTACSTPEGPIFRALGNTLRTFDLPVRLFLDLLDAFKQDVVTDAHESWDGILDYARRSANPVGRIILRLFGYEDAHRDALSDQICSALQFTNFWQDVAIDARRGRIYLPREEMCRFGCSGEDLSRGTLTPALVRLLTSVCERTGDMFNQGVALPELVRGRLRYELRMIWLGGTSILKAVKASGYDVFNQRPTLSRRHLPVLAARAIVPLTPVRF